jgi:hypothetical protein
MGGAVSAATVSAHWYRGLSRSDFRPAIKAEVASKRRSAPEGYEPAEAKWGAAQAAGGEKRLAEQVRLSEKAQTLKAELGAIRTDLR